MADWPSNRGNRFASVTCSCGSSDTVTAWWEDTYWRIPIKLTGDHAGHTVTTELLGYTGATVREAARG